VSHACAACGARERRAKLRTHGVEILECGDCGLAFWEPGVGHRAAAVYDADYFDSSEAGHGYDDYAGLEEVLRRNFRRRVAAIPRPGPEARLVDIGAAYGYAVDESRRLGWRAVGLEISRAAAVRAARATGFRVAVASADRAPLPDAAFQAATLWDVLEHLPAPGAAVAEAARLLAPGGSLVLTTGDVGSLAARLSGPRWHLYTIPEHLFFFTRESLRQLLARHGFAVESMRAEASLYTLGYLVERLRKSLLGRAGAEARWPGASLGVPVNLFDIVTVRARRCAPARPATSAGAAPSSGAA